MSDLFSKINIVVYNVVYNNLKYIIMIKQSIYFTSIKQPKPFKQHKYKEKLDKNA